MNTFNVRNAEIEKTLRALGSGIDGAIPENWGFALLLFNYGERADPGDGLFYIAKADRSDVIKVMKEFIAISEVN